MELEITKTTSQEILEGKFRNTISSIEGYLQEARGDKENGATYAARAVATRLEKIKLAFDADLKNLAAACQIKS